MSEDLQRVRVLHPETAEAAKLVTGPCGNENSFNFTITLTKIVLCEYNAMEDELGECEGEKTPSFADQILPLLFHCSNLYLVAEHLAQEFKNCFSIYLYVTYLEEQNL